MEADILDLNSKHCHAFLGLPWNSRVREHGINGAQHVAFFLIRKWLQYQCVMFPLAREIGPNAADWFQIRMIHWKKLTSFSSSSTRWPSEWPKQVGHFYSSSATVTRVWSYSICSHIAMFPFDDVHIRIRRRLDRSYCVRSTILHISNDR